MCSLNFFLKHTQLLLREDEEGILGEIMTTSSGMVSRIYAQNLRVLRNLVPMLVGQPDRYLEHLKPHLELGIPLSSVADPFEGVVSLKVMAICTQNHLRGKIPFDMPAGVFGIKGDPHVTSRRAVLFGIERSDRYPQNYCLPPYIELPSAPSIQRVSVLEVFGGANPVVWATDYMCVDSLRLLVLGEGNFEPYSKRCFARVGRASKITTVYERLRSQKNSKGNEPQRLGWPVASLVMSANRVGVLVSNGVLSVDDYLRENIIRGVDYSVSTEVKRNSLFDLPQYKPNSFLDFVGDNYQLAAEVPNLGRDFFPVE